MGLRVALVLGLGGLALAAEVGQTQLPVVDNTLGPEQSLVDQVTIPGLSLIRGGAYRGNNLFHSFEDFSIGEGSGAFFLVRDAAVENILTRVTGPNVSEILGILGTRVDDAAFSASPANVFLINPNGIVFGENSLLQLGGSFIASTSEGIKFESQAIFSTEKQSVSQLLTTSPSAFLFKGTDPGQIEVRARQPFATGAPEAFAGIGVDFGKSLILLGGEIDVVNSGLYALEGRLELGAVAGPGEVSVSEKPSLSFPTDLELANISFREGSRGIVSWNKSGDIQINSQNLRLSDSSLLGAGIFFSLGSPEAKSGSISIQTKKEIELKNSFIINEVANGSIGSAGNLVIETEDLKLSGVSTVGSLLSGTGSAGNLRIDASGIVTLDSIGSVDNLGSAIASGISESGVGNAGKVELFSKRLHLINGGTVNTSTLGQGNGGMLLIRSEEIVLDGTGGSSELPSTIGSIVAESAVGNGGSIDIATNSLKTTGGGVINASTFGQGNAGNINIMVKELASFDGSTPNEQGASGIGSIVGTGAIGDAGVIKITAGEMIITNGGGIAVGTEGIGNAGEISLTVKGKIHFDGRNNSVGSGISSVIAAGAIGNGQSIQISAGDLSITRGAGINASTQGNGNSSKVSINATGSIYLDRLADEGLSFISTSVRPTAVGNGGKIEIFASNLDIKNGSFISTDTFGQGDAGDILIATNERIFLESGRDRPFPYITTASDGIGKTGDLSLNSTQIVLDRAALFTTSTSGSGGNISISTNPGKYQSFLLKNNGLVTSTAGDNQSPGNGGNITINTPFLISLPNENSDIIANAFEGTGGNITINADAILNFDLQDEPNVEALRNNQTNDISASSALGNSGILNLAGLNADPARGSTQLPTAPTPPSQVDRTCAAQTTSANSFVATRRGGIPISPNELPASPQAQPTWLSLDAAAETNSASTPSSPPYRSRPTSQALLEASQWQQDGQGNVRLIAGTTFPVTESTCLSRTR